MGSELYWEWVLWRLGCVRGGCMGTELCGEWDVWDWVV